MTKFVSDQEFDEHTFEHDLMFTEDCPMEYPEDFTGSSPGDYERLMPDELIVTLDDKANGNLVFIRYSIAEIQRMDEDGDDDLWNDR